MQNAYKLYKKTGNENTIAAILPQDLIDDIHLHIFTYDGLDVDVTSYAGQDIKIETLGRALWSEITWEPSNKWREIHSGTYVDISKCVIAVQNNQKDDDLITLTSLFG